MFRHRRLQVGVLKSAVFGANDGIITTFAVVAGVSGANLSPNVILILGAANMIADAISMGLGDYIGEVSERKYEARQRLLPHHLTKIGVTSLVTFLAFAIAGSLPLIPYFIDTVLNIPVDRPLFYSLFTTASASFMIGSLRTFFTKGVWWRNGLEMLLIGTLSATAAYSIGALIAPLTNR